MKISKKVRSGDLVIQKDNGLWIKAPNPNERADGIYQGENNITILTADGIQFIFIPEGIITKGIFMATLGSNRGRYGIIRNET